MKFASNGCKLLQPCESLRLTKLYARETEVPVRIYSLAKELKIDSKDLVDICNRIGIANKGSALASLEDEEVEKIRNHLAKSDEPPASEEPEGSDRIEMRRPSTPTRTRKPISIGRSSTSIPAPSTPSTAPSMRGSTPTEAKSDESVPDEEPVELDEMVAETPSTPVAAPTSKSDAGTDTDSGEATDVPSAASPSAPIRRDMRRPSIGGNKIRVIGSGGKPREPGKSGSDDRKKRKDREPVINLAAIPKSGNAPKTKSNEPAPQKPEIKLTAELLSGTGKGKLPGETADETDSGGKSSRRSGGLKEFKDAAERSLRKKDGLDDEEDGGKKRSAGRRGSGLADSRKDRSKRVGIDDDDDRRHRRGGYRGSLNRKGTNTAAPRKEKMSLELPCTVRSFSEAAGVPAARVLRSLMTMGQMGNINAALEEETALLLAADLGVDIEFKTQETLESNLLGQLDSLQDAAEDLLDRPPIVTFLGHVDHGKTSLLDYLIGTQIVTGEAGGITQHIRAYQVEKDGRKISFVDTPGHEAFTEMRARGANVTDIAVLVVAAEDGIMPQTEEAISHAQAAGVPIVVAINKIDLAGADPNRVMTQLTEHSLTPSEWGGDVEVVQTSAITGQGMDELLETLLTVAELHEYQANPKRAAIGVCLESEQDASRGVTAKVVVRNGTLRVGDIVVCGNSYGRVKAMFDTLRPNKQLSEAGPSVPVTISGLDTAPGAGEKFYVLDEISQAREIAESRSDESRSSTLSVSTPKVSFEKFQDMLQSGTLGKVDERVQLNLIIRADARGSLEAIEKELSKLEHPEVEIKILQKSVGGVTVADVTLAHASEAVIIGFNVIPDEAARSLADDRNVEIRRYDIIYNLANDIKAIIEGRLKPEERVVELGRALVKQVFTVSRVGTIAGCVVVQGAIERGCRIRVNRDGRTIGDYPLDTLKRHKDDVKEVPRGMECGIKLANFNDVKQDDLLEAYRIDEVARTLDVGTR